MGGGRKGCHPLQLVLLWLLAVGVGLQRKSIRAEVLTSTIFPPSVPFLLWHGHPGWRGSVPGERHKSCSVIRLVNAVFLQHKTAMSSWLFS